MVRPGIPDLPLGALNSLLRQAGNRAQQTGLFGVLQLALGETCGMGVGRSGVLRQFPGMACPRPFQPFLGVGQLHARHLQALALVLAQRSQGNHCRQQHAQHPVHEHTAVPDQPASI